MNLLSMKTFITFLFNKSFKKKSSLKAEMFTDLHVTGKDDVKNGNCRVH